MIALVTGASQGIGAAIALRFAKEGYTVAVHSSNREESRQKAEQIAQQCRELGAEAACFAADVSDYAQCDALIKDVKAAYGRLDVLVNNAGITRDNLLLRMSEEQYDAVIASNQKSVYMLMKLAGSIMLRQKSGRIINMASVAGLYGNMGQCNYSASKGAVIAMTRTAAKELGARGITVNAIARDTHDRQHDRPAEGSHSVPDHSGTCRNAGGCGSGSGIPCRRGRQLYHRTGAGSIRRHCNVRKEQLCIE